MTLNSFFMFILGPICPVQLSILVYYSTLTLIKIWSLKLDLKSIFKWNNGDFY